MQTAHQMYHSSIAVSWKPLKFPTYAVKSNIKFWFRRFAWRSAIHKQAESLKELSVCYVIIITVTADTEHEPMSD